MEFAENGSGSFPDIYVGTCDGDEEMDEADPGSDELDDPRIRAEMACWEKGKDELHVLRGKIARVLGAFDIRVLSEQELRARISGLKPDPTRGVERGKTATVEEALFLFGRTDNHGRGPRVRRIGVSQDVSTKKPKPNEKMQAWIDARKRHHLSHAQVQMARAGDESQDAWEDRQ